MKIELQYTRVFHSLYNEQKRINCFRGGARSSKTWSILQFIAIYLLTGYAGKKHYPVGNFAVVRETLPALRASAYKDFIEILHQMNFYNKVDHRKTTLEFHYQKREVNFFSTDDINSAKLRGRKNTFVYMNEATNISKNAYDQLSLRCSEFLILDYNPAGFSNWCKEFLEEKEFKRGKVKLDISTYHDNIKNLAQPMIDEIEGLKEIDKDLYEVYNKGNWISSRNLVFEKIHLIKEMPKEFDKEFYGIDFGYQDPCTAVRILKKDKNLYIQQIFHESKLGLNDIAGKLHDFGVFKIYGDHEPLTIRELKNRGIRIKKARKGKDSIRQGLGFIRQHKIHILNTSLETIKEFREYKYKLDIDNNPTEAVLDIGSHSIDASRYALSYALRGSIRIH